MRTFFRFAFLPLVLASFAFDCAGQQAPLVIHVDAAHPGAAMSPQMFGAFFEDINFGADGGLYPELVKNRSFEFDDPLTGWHQVMQISAKGLADPKGGMSVRTEDPLNASNPHYLHLHVDDPGFAFYNTGFRGMGIQEGAEYRLSAYVRSSGPKALRATIADKDGHQVGSGKFEGFTDKWQHYETVIRATGTMTEARLNLLIDEPGNIDLDMVSLYPVDTWNHRPNGLRKDLVQLLYDMHPGFLRFPGGCIVEGRQLLTRYRWKTTVGDIAERKTIINRWNDEFDERPAPDYFQSFGLGFYEYFQLAEDIGARPLPILNCGMACEFNTSELARLEDIHEYIQDALDLIEFANGPVSSPWGKLRAQMGHPAPFHLEMIGVGNEQWGPHYIERYKLFTEALKAKYPDIQLVVAAGPAPYGEPFNSMWAAWRQLKPDIVDEHMYMSPDWFLQNSGRYDQYDRSGPKIFVGEYAAQTSGTTKDDNHNNWRGAISEAAYMTGLERNADIVRMASYAPLLANVHAWQWTPDAIWFDNLHSYGTPNYYVQGVFARNAGTRLIASTPHAEGNLYTCASIDDRTHEFVITVVHNAASSERAEIRLDGSAVTGMAKVTLLHSDDLDAENSFEHPRNVAPESSIAAVHAGVLSIDLLPWSVQVYRVAMQ